MLTVFLEELKVIHSCFSSILAHMNRYSENQSPDSPCYLEQMDISRIHRPSNYTYLTNNFFDEDGTFYANVFIRDENYNIIFNQNVLWKDIGF